MSLLSFFLGWGHLEPRPPPSSFISPRSPTLASLFFHHALLYFYLRSSQCHWLVFELRSRRRAVRCSTPPSHPGDAPRAASRRAAMTYPQRRRRRAGGRGRRAGWPAGGGAGVQLLASAAIASCAVPSTRPLPALPGRVGPGGVRNLTPRDTAASGAGFPAQRNVRHRDSSVSSRPRPWRWAAAGPGRGRSWCRHDTIAGQEGQVGRQGRAPKSPGAQIGTQCPRTAPPPAVGVGRSSLAEMVLVSEGRREGKADRGV